MTAERPADRRRRCSAAAADPATSSAPRSSSPPRGSPIRWRSRAAPRRCCCRVIERPIPGTDDRDAISPYGYPGGEPRPGRGAGPRRRRLVADGAGQPLRPRPDRGQPVRRGDRARRRSTSPTPRAESGMRKRLREQIRSNERRGWSGRRRARARGRAQRQGGLRARLRRDDGEDRGVRAIPVRQRLLRAAARGRDRLAAAGGAPGRGPGAGAIAVTSDSYLHYFLGEHATGGWRTRR